MDECASGDAEGSCPLRVLPISGNRGGVQRVWGAEMSGSRQAGDRVIGSEDLVRIMTPVIDEMIADAIASERERCARVAEGCVDDVLMMEDQWSGACEYLAKEIRHEGVP